MKKLRFVTMTTLVAVLSISCAQQQQQSQSQQQPQAEYRPTATIKDIMDSMVDPGSDYIWDAVETTVSAKGVEEKAPHTDEEWKEVRRHAIMLIEATNLLQIPGRHVAQAGEKADDPKVELAPEQIEDMINKDRAAWIKFAHGLHDASIEALKAADAKDKDKLLEIGNGIDEACEKCHLQYWYPNERKPESAPSEKDAGKKTS
jgi:cytochrome c556